MGADSKIEWTHHTFNPWIGCAHVSEACRFCYAENERFVNIKRAQGVELWGPSAQRHVTSDENWKKPLKWNRDAWDDGVRRRVFCASLADVFEGRPDLNEPRARLFDLIERCDSLDWMLLTKRPANINANTPHHWRGGWPKHVWAGTTTEDQETADERIPCLLGVPARTRFVSAEPLLGRLELSVYLRPHACDEWPKTRKAGRHGCAGHPMDALNLVIAGAESGAHKRPTDAAWIRSLRDQCSAAGVAFFLKQLADDRGRIVSLPMLDGRQWAEMPGARQ